MTYFHVTSVRNRESIREHGLDWSRMQDDVPGIAGSTSPEEAGCFLCRDEWERDWFIRMNNTGGPVDVWAVDGVSEDDLVESNGHTYYRGEIPPERLHLVLTDVFEGSAFGAP